MKVYKNVNNFTNMLELLLRMLVHDVKHAETYC